MAKSIFALRLVKMNLRSLYRLKFSKANSHFAALNLLMWKKREIKSEHIYHYLISAYKPWGCWIPPSKYMRMNSQRNWIIILPKRKIIVSQKSQTQLRRKDCTYEFHIFIQIQTRRLQFKTHPYNAVSKRKHEIYEIMYSEYIKFI